MNKMIVALFFGAIVAMAYGGEVKEYKHVDNYGYSDHYKNSYNTYAYGYPKYGYDNHGYENSYGHKSYSGYGYQSYQQPSYGYGYQSYHQPSYGYGYQSYQQPSYGYGYQSYQAAWFPLEELKEWIINTFPNYTKGDRAQDVVVLMQSPFTF